MSPNIFFFFGYYARIGRLTLNRQFWERPEILRKINDLTEHVISTLITDIFIDVAIHSLNYLIDYDARWTALVPMLIFTLWLNKRISSMFFFLAASRSAYLSFHRISVRCLTERVSPHCRQRNSDHTVIWHNSRAGVKLVKAYSVALLSCAINTIYWYCSLWRFVSTTGVSCVGKKNDFKRIACYAREWDADREELHSGAGTVLCILAHSPRLKEA